MEHARNGDLKVSYEQELFGRRRNGTLPAYPDLTREAIPTGPARPPLPPKSTPSRRRTYADGELDVFSAERYFKGAMDGDNKDCSAAPVETAAAGTMQAVPVGKPVWTCPSAASAGSVASANSQTVLLREARIHRGYSSKKCCLQVAALLRPCSGKRAVRVDCGAATTETTEPSKPAASSRIEWYRDLRMQKAGLGVAGDGHRGVVADLPPKFKIGASDVAAAAGREEKAGEYTSASFRTGSFTLQAPVKVSCGGGGVDDDDDDGGSESSSDLFEIKSLMIGDCPYEPSEASIQWSVVTASAVDMSAASERGGARGRPPVAVRQNRDRPVGLLTGCVSRRAVDVSAMAAVRRFPDPPGRRRMDG